jgi:outer membrane protein TolC
VSHLALVAGVLLAIPTNVWASPRFLSLREAVEYTLENSPVFDSARKTQSVRELEYKSALAKILPSLDFTTTNGLQNNIPIASTTAANPIITSNPSAPWYSSLSLGLTENLYDNGVSLTQIGIAGLNRELAAISYQKTRDDLTLGVVSEFYRFSLATVLLEVRKQQQGMLEKQFRTLTNQYQQGFKTRGDYIRFKTQVQRAEIDRITSENNVIQAEANLRKLLGVSIQAPEPPSFDPVKVDRDRKGDGVLPNQPPSIEAVYDYRITKIQEEIYGKNVTLVKRNYWPQVSVSSGVNYVNQNYLNSDTPFAAGHQLSWNALVILQYNLWDWGTRKRDVEIAEYNRDIQGNVLSQNLLDINAQITGLMADVARVSKNYSLTQELLKLEEESNRDFEAQYREGKVTYLDLVTELNNLLDAKVQFFTSYFDALNSSAKYKYYEGKLYESLMEK